MVDSISNLFGNQSQVNQGTGKSVLGKDDFMKLMIQQLKFQDPLNPMDSSQYSAQLAQFSSLEQLTNINDSLTKSIDANFQLTQSINNTLSSALIGKSVKLGGGDLNYTGQDKVNMGYSLAEGADNVDVKIYDENGNVVKTFLNSANGTGEHKLSWDFTDNDGNKVAVGKYTFKVEAKDLNGETVTAEIYKLGVIDAIKFSESGTKLMVDNLEYYLSDVSEIQNNSDGGK
ncbi:MAG: flagellar hook capping protein [Ignavibacteriales bacterium]|nr:flagellar hook capping protein [Ignavibacteriales bacterium]